MFNLTNPQIVGGLNRRMPSAIETIYRRYRPRIFELSRQLTANDIEAEDLCGEVFQKLLTSKKPRKTIKEIRDFLYVSVRNLAEDKRRRRQTRETNAKQFTGMQPLVSDDAFAKAETIAALYKYVIRSVDKLSPRCKIVFQKYYLEEKAIAEIAIELKISEKRAFNCKSEALRKLRIEIKPFGKFIFTITFII